MLVPSPLDLIVFKVESGVATILRVDYGASIMARMARKTVLERG